MKKLTILILLSGCAPTYAPDTLVWVGCHTVHQNPSPEGSTGYMLLRHLVKGERLYLQQIDRAGRYDVTVGQPCK
jgi:hypothetical protein